MLLAGGLVGLVGLVVRRSWSGPVVGVVEEFGFGDVLCVFGWGEGQDGRGVEDCGGWEGEGGEDSAAFLGRLVVSTWLLSVFLLF